MLDRNALEQWLTEKSRTWRWSSTPKDAYQGLEIKGSQVSYFQWTHQFGQGSSPDTRTPPAPTHTQTTSDLLKNGPPIPVPAEVLEEVKTWLEQQA